MPTHWLSLLHVYLFINYLFIYGVFNDADNSSLSITPNYTTINFNELERMWKENAPHVSLHT